MFDGNLSARFGSVWRSPLNFFLPASQLMLTADGKKFVVAFACEKRRVQDDVAWLVAINPADYPVPRRHLPKDVEGTYLKGLMLISDAVEALLTNTLGVTRQGWFFEGWEENSPGVRTPVELPWQVDVPEMGWYREPNVDVTLSRRV
jgi:hypothetical protein